MKIIYIDYKVKKKNQELQANTIIYAKKIYVPKAAVVVYKTLRGRSNMLTKLLIANLAMRLFEIIAGC